jgi:hypothetical protein
MTIEWDETVETKRRVRMLVDGRGSPSAPAAAVWAPGFRDATIDDLRRACEAAGLTLASAQHAEDLEKLGREMAEVVAQRDEARKERDQYLQACENWRKLDAPLSEFRRVLRVGDYESTLDAARRMSREVEVCVGQLDHVMARAESARLEAYTLGRKSAEEQEAAWEDPDRTGTEARRLAIRAVARHVRAERHACLVARAVALGCGVNLWSYEDGSKTNVRARVQVVDGNHTEEREVRPADVPATLARLLDEVEAARKAVSK